MNLKNIKNNDDYLIDREERNMGHDLDDEELEATRKMNKKNEIEVGEYVRTKEGYIGKYIKDTSIKGVIEIKDNEITFSTMKNNITKHRKNITDLIEAGDIIKVLDNGSGNEHIYIMFDNSMIRKFREYIEKDDFKFLDILTKEQYNENCYKVEE